MTIKRKWIMSGELQLGLRNVTQRATTDGRRDRLKERGKMERLEKKKE